MIAAILSTKNLLAPGAVAIRLITSGRSIRLKRSELDFITSDSHNPARSSLFNLRLRLTSISPTFGLRWVRSAMKPGVKISAGFFTSARRAAHHEAEDDSARSLPLVLPPSPCTNVKNCDWLDLL